MSEVPDDLRYTASHEWVRAEEDNIVTVGISDHAQHLLGDLVFVEPPEPGARLNAEEGCAVVESVKAASDVYAPLSGEVVEVNESLADAPEQVNEDPYGDGWLFRMRADNPDAIEGLLTADGYQKQLEDEA